MNGVINTLAVITLIAGTIAIVTFLGLCIADWIADGKARRVQAQRAETEARLQMHTHLAMQRMYDVARSASHRNQ